MAIVIDFMAEEGETIDEKYPRERWFRCGQFFQREWGEQEEPRPETKNAALRQGATHLVWKGEGWWLAVCAR